MIPINVVAPDGSMFVSISNLLERAGLKVEVGGDRNKVGTVTTVDWIDKFAFQRPYDIPRRLQRGLFDVAIVGEDWLKNWGLQFPELLKLPMGRGGNKPVRIVLAAKELAGFQKPGDLPQGCVVATEYVQLATNYFTKLGRQDIVVEWSPGNTEDKIEWGDAQAIVEVTESGRSLKAHGLAIIDEIMKSNTVVVANAEAYQDPEKLPSIDCFRRLIEGAFMATFNVMMTANVPEEVIDEAARIIGGLKGPSRSPIQGVPGCYALQSVVPRAREVFVIFELLQIGVTGIVVNRDSSLIMS
jgi:ATP phosphoribosyltransferase